MKLIVLDRDGVINFDSDQYVKSPDEWRPIPGSLEAIARLGKWGYRVVGATNQSGIGQGLFDMDTLNVIHEKMLRATAQAGGRIDAIFFCPHINGDKCDCRKPRAGMLREIAARYNTDLSDAPAVGDSMRDLKSAADVGARPMLALTGRGRQTVADRDLPEGTEIFPDLAAAVAALAP